MTLHNFLKENPLRISEKEADWIDDTLLEKKINALNKSFSEAPGNTDKILFTDLPPDIQTVVYSVAHHKGTGGYLNMSDLNSSVFKKDRHGIIDALMKEAKGNSTKGLAQRRFKEAVYLYNKFSGGMTP